MTSKNTNNCPFLDEKPISNIGENSAQELIALRIEELINNCSYLENKSILLNGQWGSGKTSIIEYLKKSNSGVKILKIDAWDAPKTLIIWDILKRIADKVLEIKHQRDRVKNERFHQWFSGSYKRNFENAEWTTFAYILIFVLGPLIGFFTTLYNNRVKTYLSSFIMFLVQPSTTIGFMITIFVSTLIFVSYKKLSDILFPFFSGSASQYAEYSEGEDCPPSKAEEIAWHIRNYYRGNKLAVFIDNLDRLEGSAQRNYLDALFIVMEAFFDTKNNRKDACEVWFIIVADKSKMLRNKNFDNPKNPNNSDGSSGLLWQNYADKIAPLQLFLPNPTQEILNLEFRKLWNETELKDYAHSIVDYALSFGTYTNYRDVKKTLNSIYLLNSMLKKIVTNKEASPDILLLAICFVSIKNREPKFTFDREEIQKNIKKLPAFITDEELFIEYIYSAYYLVPLINKDYIFKLIDAAVAGASLKSLFTLVKNFREKVLEHFRSYLFKLNSTPEEICEFYLKVFYPIKIDMTSVFPLEKEDSILESFCKGHKEADYILNSFCETPMQMIRQGKVLAQLYKMSSKDEKLSSLLNETIFKWNPEEQIDFIIDFIQEESPSLVVNTVFHSILSKQFLTRPFISTIYSREDIFTKDIRQQILEALSAKSMSAFIELLKEDIKNFPNYKLFDEHKLFDEQNVQLNIGLEIPIIELIFNIYCYTQNNSQYPSFIDALPSYEELIKKMVIPIFQDALIFCRLHKEIVRDNSNPYLEDYAILSALFTNHRNMYSGIIFFCLSQNYNNITFHSLKTKMLNSIIEKELLNRDQFKKVHEELYDIFIENGNEVAKEFLDKYRISRDKLGN